MYKIVSGCTYKICPSQYHHFVPAIPARLFYGTCTTARTWTLWMPSVDKVKLAKHSVGTPGYQSVYIIYY